MLALILQSILSKVCTVDKVCTIFDAVKHQKTPNAMQAPSKTTVSIDLPPIGHPNRLLSIGAPTEFDLSGIDGLVYSHEWLGPYGVKWGHIWCIRNKKCIAVVKARFPWTEKRMQRY